MNMPCELYTDGSCLQNPGPGGVGYVIRYWEMKDGEDLPQLNQIEKSIGYVYTTNNRMEILAGVLGLQEISENVKNGIFNNISTINLLSDSKYFTDAVNRKWIDKWQQNNWMTSSYQGRQPSPVKNKDLWEMYLQVVSLLAASNILINVQHIPGHKGYEFNELADKLAQSASKGTTFINDTEYEKLNKR